MNFLEEAYEAVDALDLDDPVLMCEELGKPFDSRELLARVRANLRRQAPIEELVVLRYGDLVYDTKALLLACGRERSRSPKSWAL